MKSKWIWAGACAVLLAACAPKSGSEGLTKSGLDPSKFETTVDGKAVKLYVLKNKAGMEVCATNYGGRIVSVMVPDRNNQWRDVVLGHDSIADYIHIDGNFGALIGRYGNRINQGRFTLDGVEYQLPQNNYGHCLHGGPKGFHHSVWNATQPNDTTLELTLYSPDGEAGFPGNLDVKVVYTLTSDNALCLQYTATTDKPTVVNLTNHSYFNLSGNAANDVLNDTVQFDADAFTPIDSTFMTWGEIRPVEGTPFDFRAGKTVGQDIEADDEQLKNGLGYDHNMVLNTGGDLSKVACRISDPTNGIVLRVYTTEPGIQFYTGNFLDGKVKGKGGIAYPRRGAICVETQHYPDSPNQPNYPSVVLRPGETYSSTCIYKFSVE
ncbi:aldose epimerase family protein [uncultured Barnesiella sp.]|uniref:aldose epimerase family protein n=1 Tax=uncultured Barnesiella sp. TaxID=584861 RepID=UPI002613760A|nr:aldose epimerase family protein [uncultured Barnesiella sp.]